MARVVAPGIHHYVTQRGIAVRKLFSQMRVIGRRGDFPSEELPEEKSYLLCRHERTGRPVGGKRFISLLDDTSGRVLRRQRPKQAAK